MNNLLVFYEIPQLIALSCESLKSGLLSHLKNFVKTTQPFLTGLQFFGSLRLPVFCLQKHGKSNYDERLHFTGNFYLFFLLFLTQM